MAGSNTSALGWVMGVSITPGQTALTLMRSLEYCVVECQYGLLCWRPSVVNSLRRLRRILSYLLLRPLSRSRRLCMISVSTPFILSKIVPHLFVYGEGVETYGLPAGRLYPVDSQC